MKFLYTLGLAYLAIAALVLGRPTPQLNTHADPPSVLPVEWANAGPWFQHMKPFCNPVEVETQHRWNPAPRGWEGTGFSAACYGLAGRIDRARALIQTLDSREQWEAVGIVFNVGHPVADAGNNIAAGPIMELVVEFWPNHYMALYHAGIAAHETGRPSDAVRYLKEFLVQYSVEDGFRSHAVQVLKDLR